MRFEVSFKILIVSGILCLEGYIFLEFVLVIIISIFMEIDKSEFFRLGNRRIFLVES